MVSILVSPDFLNRILFFCFVCVCLPLPHYVCFSVYVEVRGQPQDSGLSFHHVGLQIKLRLLDSAVITFTCLLVSGFLLEGEGERESGGRGWGEREFVMAWCRA